MEQVKNPEDLGLSSSQLDCAYGLVQDAVARGDLMGAAIQIARGGKMLPTACFGRCGSHGAPVAPDTIFLIASITKPIACAAVMKQIEAGRVGLDDCVADHLPEFDNREKSAVAIRHLLTHTSGLPDMLPENHDLRRRHAPLSEFVSRMCDLDLLFEPGTQISYQSCGIALLGEIVERCEGRRLPEVLRTAFFNPLGLGDTSLGRQDDRQNRVSEIKLPQMGDAGGPGTDWDWNSDYWQHFGAPWGGMFTTARELATLFAAIQNGGEWDGVRILSPAAVTQTVCDQTARLNTLPESEKLRQRWGLGWRLQSGSTYGDLVSRQTFGHGGATGTLAWCDRQSKVICVILTNDPVGARHLRTRVSSAVAAAVL